MKNKRFVYLRDEEQFYDAQRRETTDEERVFNVLKRALSAEEALTTIKAIKIAGIDRDSLRTPKAGINSFLDRSYGAIKASLNLRVYSAKGVEWVFSLNGRHELTRENELKFETFSALIANSPATLEAMEQEYRESENAPLYQTRLTMQTFVRALFERFRFDPSKRLLEEPALLSWNPSIPAYRVLDSSILQPGPTPNWDSWLARVDFPETFKAYVWSIFQPDNWGRQALWIKGGGNDGKSSALNAIISFMGREHTCSVTPESLKGSFFFASAIGKRLAVYMDCKNTHVLRSESIKSLLGRDTVNINGKYVTPYSGQVYCKLLVSSNDLPQLNYNDNSELTRLLLIHIESFLDPFGDPFFEQNLEVEFPAFLFKCKEAYVAQCPKGRELIVPPRMKETISSACSSIDSDLIERFVEDELELGPTYAVSKLELHGVLKDYFAKNWLSSESRFAFNDLTKYLMKKGVTFERLSTGMRIYKGVRLKERLGKITR